MKKLIITRDSDQRLIKMFMDSQERVDSRHRSKFPVILTS